MPRNKPNTHIPSAEDLAMSIPNPQALKIAQLTTDINEVSRRNNELSEDNSRLENLKDEYEEVLKNEFTYHKLRCIELKRLLYNSGIEVDG